MAVINVSCPQCATGYKFDEVHRGKQAKCKKAECGATFVIDEASAGPPVAGAAPAALAAPSQGTNAEEKRPHGEDGIPLDWEPGDVILDLYEVIKLPGTKNGYAEGGMGRVNLVHHREWRKDLAVKSVLPAKSASVRDVENFKTEAEHWVDKIGLHPNVVACHYVRILSGVPRVFIEYVDGGTLQEWIASKRLYEGGPEAALARILDVAIQTAWGLHYVHELDLIHQDVKPLNVMMTADGTAKVTDFGLAGAKAVAFEDSEHGPEEGTILATWGGMMTPAYCSPEQAECAAKQKAGTPREQWSKLTRRTDVWSWAASVLHMFLGRIAWPAGQVAHVGLQCEPDEPDLPPMPPAVKDLLRSCLQKRPEDRPHDLMQVADALRPIYQQVTGQAYPREPPKPDDLLADSLNNRAVSLMDLKKQEAARQKWQEALRVDPRHPEATYNWGLIRWRAARMTDEQLLRELREVRNSCADSARVDYLLGFVHLERNDSEAATRSLEKAGKLGDVRAEVKEQLTQSGELPSAFAHGHGHRGGVYSVAFSPDGCFALSGSRDETLLLWEVSSGFCLRTFRGHRASVTSVAFSPDGSFALSGSKDKTLRLWEVNQGQWLRSFEGHTASVTSVAFSTDGCFALSGSEDKTLGLWDVSNGNRLRTFEGHTASVTSVAFGPDGSLALSGSEDGKLRLWEVRTSRTRRTRRSRSFNCGTKPITSVAFSPDGCFALCGSEDKTLRLWEVSSGKHLRTFEGHLASVTSVAFSPDGCFALSGSEDSTVRLWELDWVLECTHPADWNDRARPHLEVFLTLHTPYLASLPVEGKPTEEEIERTLLRQGRSTWKKKDFQRLLETLGCAGYGWLRPEGIRRELNKMAATWQGPPPLI